MKTVVFSLIAFIFFNSCIEFNRNRDTMDEKSGALQPDKKKQNFSVQPDSVLTQWINYYKQKKPDFSLAGFKWCSTDSLMMMPGHVLGNFDREFDTIYTDFLIFNPSKSLYLDFDSFNWSLDKNGTPSFAVDQEIDMVDVEGRTVNRIGFNGPSYWAEDAFWVDDSTIVLLQNNYEKRPEIIRFRLKDWKKDVFRYTDTLPFQTDYARFRIRQKKLIK